VIMLHLSSESTIVASMAAAQNHIDHVELSFLTL